ncbi:hypothetical protein WJX72_008824 [[Myrmecia] bisecta]|uniref:Glutathione peroxidase n=1 Tax=[Myrmecia] bisecta TaxID=41462 RepID=A0AAW1Q7W2_9CHLO
MAAAVADQPTSFHDFKVKDIDGKAVDLSKYRGKVVLVVNVASACGFTPQYKEMAELQSKYGSKGFTLLAFPCNQFGAQEPGSPQEIKKFAAGKGANFPIMEKVDVNGASAEPVWKFMKSKQGGLLISDIKWNFSKFLIDREGNVVKRYGSATTPMSIAADVENLL